MILMATVPRRTGDGRPVLRTVAMRSPGFGGGRVRCSHAPSRHRYGGWTLGCVLRRLLLGVGPAVASPEDCLWPGCLSLVGLSDSRPEEGGPVSWAPQGSAGPLFFLRAKGSRLGYPWSFTPTVVPEAGRASQLKGGNEKLGQLPIPKSRQLGVGFSHACLLGEVSSKSEGGNQLAR